MLTTGVPVDAAVVDLFDLTSPSFCGKKDILDAEIDPDPGLKVPSCTQILHILVSADGPVQYFCSKDDF